MNTRIILHFCCLFLIAGLVRVMDMVFGCLAYAPLYFAICLTASAAIFVFWFPISRKTAAINGAIAFLVLLIPLVSPAPSERLLRSAMLGLEKGASSELIEPMVQKKYQDRRYVLPEIMREQEGGRERVVVSLISQEPGNCTAIVFLVEDGKIVHRFFSPD